MIILLWGDCMYGYEEFKDDVYTLTNINLDLYKERQMKRRIDSLITKKIKVLDYKEFFDCMKSDDEFLHEFVSYLTINVSEFYRNSNQWILFEDTVLPYLIDTFGTRLRIWSAACSTGDEPYTIAMIIAKHMPLKDVKIFASDIDDNVLAFAKQGVYSERSLAGLPKELLEANFKKEGNNYIINDSIKKCVSFKKHNLLENVYPKDIDMIVCRNVVIYFTDDAKNMVYEKFHNSLKKNGILFIGSTEQIIKSKELGYDTYKSFFYKKCDI